MNINLIKWLMVSILVVLALIGDINEKKIRNSLNYSFILLGWIINFFDQRLAGLSDSLIGTVVPVAFLIILYILKMLGAGDIKLFSAVGAVMGCSFAIQNMLISFLVGGGIALLIMLFRRNSIKRLKYFMEYLKSIFLTGKIDVYETQISNSAGKFRFAYAVFIGLLIQAVY